MKRLLALCLGLACWPIPAHADAVLLFGESYGRFGSLAPTGHAALYLTGVCAASPVVLRRCEAGERGVVISRYHRVGGADWMAIPILPYLYGVERAGDVPGSASPSEVLEIRDAYRRAHLRSVVPDGPDGRAPDGNWIQLIGAAYDRQLLAFTIPTTPGQDTAVVAALNARPNRARFNILTRNCADFVRDVLHLYHPKLVANNWIADLGVTTPKQIARAMVRRARQHPEFAGAAFVVQQIPGSRPASRPARGVLESLLRTKKYAIPMTLVQPWVSVGVAAGYLAHGRFDPHRYATSSRGAVHFEAAPDIARVARREGAAAP
jgi:hypothetical protein